MTSGEESLLSVVKRETDRQSKVVDVCLMDGKGWNWGHTPVVPILYDSLRKFLLLLLGDRPC